MSHPIIHAKSAQKEWAGKWEDYIHLENWMDETKGWVASSIHRMFRHHSEGIFEAEKLFGSSFINSDGKIVYTRYVLERHIREDCYGKVPSAKEWLNAIVAEVKPEWMLRTIKLDDNGNEINKD